MGTHLVRVNQSTIQEALTWDESREHYRCFLFLPIYRYICSVRSTEYALHISGVGQLSLIYEGSLDGIVSNVWIFFPPTKHPRYLHAAKLKSFELRSMQYYSICMPVTQHCSLQTRLISYRAISPVERGASEYLKLQRSAPYAAIFASFFFFSVVFEAAGIYS
jgi:hypothetical protein